VVKAPGLTGDVLRGLTSLGELGVCGTPGGAVKCVEIGRNAGGESDRLGLGRRSGTKARGANGIRYPGSPGRKRWALVRGGFGLLGRSESASAPPGEYGRKAETQRN
jgi:hypothetical protein